MPALIRVMTAAVAVLALLVLGASTAPASTSSSVVSLVNSERSAAGQSALTPHQGLAATAQSWAVHMADSQTLAHNPGVQSQLPSGWSRWGENVAYHSHPSASALHTNLMNSAPHRANILGDFTHIGVGYATASDGHGYLVQVFATLSTSTPAPSPTPSPTREPERSPSPSPSPSPSSTSSPAPSPTQAPTQTPSPSPSPSQDQGQALPDGWIGPGSDPKDVKALQEQLVELGYAASAVDGDYGPLTRGEVVRFQRDHGLVDDGLVGPVTQAVIDDELAATQRQAEEEDQDEDTTAGKDEEQERQPLQDQDSEMDEEDRHQEVLPVIVAHSNTPGSPPLADGAPISAAPPATSDAWQVPAVAAGVVAAFGLVLVTISASRSRSAKAATRSRQSSQACQALLEAADSALGVRA